MIYQFKIPGDPHTKLRPRFSRGHAYTPKETKSAEKTIALIAKHLFSEMLHGPVFVCVTFSFQIPSSIKGKKREKMAGLMCTKKPDADNVEKLLCDALNEIAFKDDAQVSLVLKRKIWADEGSTDVMMGQVDGVAYSHIENEIWRWKKQHDASVSA